MVAGMRPGAPGWGADPDDMLFYDPTGTERALGSVGGDQRQYYRRIVAAMTGKGVNPVSPAQAVAVMAVVDAAIGSARTGRVVEMQISAEERAPAGG